MEAKKQDELWRPPPEFHEYNIIRPLGGGSMGQVFLAQDRLLDRHVAIKFMVEPKATSDPAGVDRNEQLRERFMIEARAAARIQHPNVVAIYRVGQLDQRPYIELADAIDR